MKIFALKHNSKEPAVKGWQQQAEMSVPSLANDWLAAGLNIGVATGEISGVFVLDCDNLMARLEVEQLGIPNTYTVRTPRGFHLYFRHPGWKVTNHAGARFWEHLRYAGDAGIVGLDVRGDGGYVVAPPSHYVPTDEERAKGKAEGSYVVDNDAPIADAPDWILKRLLPKEPKVDQKAAAYNPTSETTPYGNKSLNDEVTLLVNTPHGSINNQINISAYAIGQLVAGGEISEYDGRQGLQNALIIMGLSTEEKAQGTMQRGFEAGLLVPRASPATPIKAAVEMTPDELFGERPVPTEERKVAPLKVGNKSLIPQHKPKFVTGTGIPDFFAGCVYIVSCDKIFLPNGELVNKSGFDTLYGGSQFPLDSEGSAKTRSAWEAFRLNGQYELPKVMKMAFRPEMPPGQIIDIDGLEHLNVYIPIETPRKEGDPTPFLNHINKLLPNGNDAELLLHWMSAVLQNIGKKARWWPVIQGTKGNGKSTIMNCMLAAVGRKFYHLANADTIVKTGNQFNDWICNKLFLGINEIRSSDGNRDLVETLKDIVTDDVVAVEGKGVKASTSDNRANGMMITNHRDACPVDKDERRWGIFFTAQQSADDVIRDGMDADYFINLYDWLSNGGYAIVTNYLKTMPLKDEYNPFVKQIRAPITSSTQYAIAETRSGLEQEIIEAVENGEYGFSGGCISANAVKELAAKFKYTATTRAVNRAMSNLGYITHPILESNRGRCTRTLEDGTRPVLYFKKGCDLLSVSDKTALGNRIMALWISKGRMHVA